MLWRRIAVSMCLIAVLHCAGAPKIAIFDEPGFPNASTRDAAFYRKAVGGDVLGLKDMPMLKDYDTVLFPHGGYMPAAAEPYVSELMLRGGTVIVTGDIQEPPLEPTEKRIVSKDAQQLDFEEKYGLSHGGPLTLCDGRWIVKPVSAGYEEYRAPRWFEEFDLWGWPNRAQSYAPVYMRPFDCPVKLNPLLAKSGLPKALLPPSKPMMLARLCSGETGDHALDVFIPLYLFEASSGRPYKPFAQAGKSKEDCAADGFIYRRFRPHHFGTTLVVMGKTGRLLLDSERGEAVIQSILRLASSPLPGSFPIPYILRIHALERDMADYNLLNAELSAALKHHAVRCLAEGTEAPSLSRLKVLRSEFNRLNNRFDGILNLKDRRQQVADETLLEMESLLHSSREILRKELVAVQAEVSPVDHGEAKHPWKRFRFKASRFGPRGIAETEYWEKVREMGITNPFQESQNWDAMRELNRRYGFSSHYLAIPMHRNHPEKKQVDSAVFNPQTGTVKPVKARVWEKDAPGIDSAVIRHLRQASENPGISGVVHGDERDFQWSLWGEYMRGKFLAWLREKYRDIEALNREYNTGHASFDDVLLPLKRPETQSEHALWEDWTRYREIYRIEWELRRWMDLIRRHAPTLQHWVYQSYHLQKKHPANGINFYEFGKLLDIASLESSSSPHKEVITYDVTAFGKKHVNPEWAAFYFPTGSRIGDMNRMRQYLWDEAACGTIGWHLFMGGSQSRVKYIHTPLMTPNGNYQPAGLALRETARELNAARRLFLDGARDEPEVRIIYSPTSRRHTSWPGIEDDRPLQCVTGYNEAFKVLHIPARVIDEQAVMEGLLPEKCRFLIVPAVEYMNRSLLEQLNRFMQNGGTVIASPDSGRFDQYGHKHDSLLELAGVRPVKATDSGFRMFTPSKLEFLFPKETRALLRYADGGASLTETRVGEGRLLICGLPLGREYYNTGKGLNSLLAVVSAVGVSRPILCSDPNLVIRPWRLDGRVYLVCYYKERSSVDTKPGAFPLATAPSMMPFTLNLSGQVRAKDWLTGADLPAKSVGKDTEISGLIANPGGCILELQLENDDFQVRRIASERMEEKSASGLKRPEAFTFPCAGVFFAEWGKIDLGGYVMAIEAENDGNWDGRVFVSLTRDGRTLRRECKSNSKITFRFNDRTVVFQCRKAQAFMPVNVEGAFSEMENAGGEGCRVQETEDRVILQNRYLYAVILPSLGGRIAELRQDPNAPNHLFLNERLVQMGAGQTYQDFGGLEYNPGVYQGDGWNVPFQYRIQRDSRGILLHLMRSHRCRMQRGGEFSYELFYRISADSPFLETTVRMYNEMDAPADLKLRTHPVFLAGGDCNVQDTFFWQAPSGLQELPYRPGRSEFYPNAGNWFAVIDGLAGEGVVQTFSAAAIPSLYCWNGSAMYNAELHFLPVQTQPKNYAEFSFATAPVAGLGRIDGFSDLLMVDFDVRELRTILLPLRNAVGNVKIELRRGDRPIAELVKNNLRLAPNQPYSGKLQMPALGEGDYELSVVFGNARFRKAFRVEAQSRDDFGAAQQLRKLQSQYETSPSPELRRQIFRLSGTLCQE
ncbi:MAG: beta-galactosidase trimerization domain-containing protein [Victivallales bacterium]|nr:beta-galactosidase trimerization domain-containing protein [Victivallales bacterium]